MRGYPQIVRENSGPGFAHLVLQEDNRKASIIAMDCGTEVFK
jgi:hypothetical protein